MKLSQLKHPSLTLTSIGAIGISIFVTAVSAVPLYRNLEAANQQAMLAEQQHRAQELALLLHSDEWESIFESRFLSPNEVGLRSLYQQYQNGVLATTDFLEDIKHVLLTIDPQGIDQGETLWLLELPANARSSNQLQVHKNVFYRIPFWFKIDQLYPQNFKLHRIIGELFPLEQPHQLSHEQNFLDPNFQQPQYSTTPKKGLKRTFKPATSPPDDQQYQTAINSLTYIMQKDDLRTVSHLWISTQETFVSTPIPHTSWVLILSQSRKPLYWLVTKHCLAVGGVMLLTTLVGFRLLTAIALRLLQRQHEADLQCQRAEAKLNEERNLHQLMVDSNPAAIVASTTSGTIISLNPSLQIALGLPARSAWESGKNWQFLNLCIAPEDRERVAQARSQVTPANTVQYESRLIDAQGQVRWFAWYVRAIELQGEQSSIARLMAAAGEHSAALRSGLEFLSADLLSVESLGVKSSGVKSSGAKSSVQPPDTLRSTPSTPHFILDVGIDITDRKHAEADLSLLQVIIQRASEAESFNSALLETLTLFSQCLGWDYGEVWRSVASPCMTTSSPLASNHPARSPGSGDQTTSILATTANYPHLHPHLNRQFTDNSPEDIATNYADARAAIDRTAAENSETLENSEPITSNPIKSYPNSAYLSDSHSSNHYPDNHHSGNAQKNGSSPNSRSVSLPENSPNSHVNGYPNAYQNGHHTSSQENFQNVQNAQDFDLNNDLNNNQNGDQNTDQNGYSYPPLYPVETQSLPSSKFLKFTRSQEDTDQKSRYKHNTYTQGGHEQHDYEHSTYRDTAYTVQLPLVCLPDYYSPTVSYPAQRHFQRAAQRVNPRSPGFHLSLADYIAQTRTPQYFEDLHDLSLEIFPRRNLALACEFQACLGLPIHSGGRTIAVLLFFRTARRHTEHLRLSVLEAIVTQLGSIFEHLQVVEALSKTEAQYRSIFRNVIEGLFRRTVDGYYINVNPALAHIFGYATPEELINDPIDPLERYVTASSYIKLERRLKIHGSVVGFKAEIYRKDRSTIWIEEVSRAVRDNHGEILYYEGSIVDVTERCQTEDKLRYNATHDNLTGLWNRSWFVDQLQRILKRVHRYPSQKFALLFLDLNNFKLINDSMGHLIGDRLLVALSQRLNQVITEGQYLARLGGDEFTICLERINNLEEVTQFAKLICNQLKRPFQIERYQISVRVSLGIVIGSNHYDSPEMLLKDADIAMYHAKAKSKESNDDTSQYAIFTAEMGQLAQRRLDLENDLRHAIEYQELSLYYQPIVDLHSLKTCGFEALVRWHHVHYNSIPPSEFILIAEESGTIVKIGFWVLREACRQLHTWKLQHPDLCIQISVNVSSRQLNQDFVTQLDRVLKEFQIQPGELKLEITETALMSDIHQAKLVLDAIKERQIPILLDDFGTGYCSLNYLYELPIHTLKIDRSFIQTIDAHPERRQVIDSILNLAHNLNLNVIAEGVETDEHLQYLQHQNHCYVQGYYFSPAVPAEQAATMLDKVWSVVSTIKD